MGMSLPKKLAAEIRAAGRGLGVNAAALGAVAGTEPNATVPVPPSVNNLFLTVGRKRVKTPEYREWLEQSVPALARLRKPERFPVRITVTLFGNVNQARDVANVEKAIGDALVLAGIIPDDSIRAGVWETIQRYRPGAAGMGPVAIVTVEPIGAGEM